MNVTARPPFTQHSDLQVRSNQLFCPGRLALLAGLLLSGLTASLLPAAEVTVLKTNKIDRVITNFVEVTVPQNRFVNVYHTNYIPLIRTNIVDVYATNFVIRPLTNEIKVTQLQTNRVNAYRTNVNVVNLTNLETVFRFTTNWISQPVTNHVAVSAYRTNVFDAYHTNYQALNLTNWRTVLVMQTNWTTQDVTNTVGLPKTGTATTATAASAIEPASEPANSLGAVVLSSAFTLEATRTRTALPNQQVEVVLKLKANPGQFANVQQWRIESEDGSVLCFGSENEFKRGLPPGRYKVEVRTQKDKNASVLITRGTLGVTAREVWVQPKPVAMR